MLGSLRARLKSVPAPVGRTRKTDVAAAYHVLAAGQPRTMSLYHEAAEVLSASSGGSLKNRIFTRKDLKSPPQQVYALALETCKWSSVLKEVIDASEMLRHEKKVGEACPRVICRSLVLFTCLAYTPTHDEFSNRFAC